MDSDLLLKFELSSDLNPDDQDTPSPLVVRVYELRNADEFDKRIQECVDSGGQLLDLSDLGLKEIPNKLPKMLKHLSISNNKIKELSDLTYLQELEVFDCCGNYLEIVSNLLDILARI